MSMYDESDCGEDLYSSTLQFNEATAKPSEVEPPASEAVSAAARAIVSPASLITDVLPADPSESKIPIGLAVFGFCVALIVWANSLDGGRKS